MHYPVCLLLLMYALRALGEPAAPPGDATVAPPAADAEPGAVPVAAPDGPEALLLAALDDGRLDPRALRLDADGAGFLGRFEAPAGRAAPAIALLVVPPSGGVITGSRLVDALLAELPAAEHAALAVQPPLLERGAGRDAYLETRDEGLRRLAAAAEHLRANGAPAVAVLGIGDGAALASAYAAQSGSVSALFTAGAWEGELPGDILPVYELVFSRDVRARALAGDREKASRRERRPYRITELSGTGHIDADTAAAVARTVRGWLRAFERSG